MERIAAPNFSDPDCKIAMCGVYCGGCPVYKVRCYGCRSDDHGPLQKRKSKWNCKKRACNMEQGLNHCGECTKIPCSIRKPLDKRYIENYQIDLVQNCRDIKENGSQAWIATQQKKYTCPKCGCMISPYDGRCLKCKQIGIITQDEVFKK